MTTPNDKAVLIASAIAGRLTLDILNGEQSAAFAECEDASPPRSGRYSN